MREKPSSISVTETSTVLLEQLSQGATAEVWQRFVATWRPRLQRLLRKLGVQEVDSEDAVQAALARIHTALMTGRYSRSRGRLSSWMFAVAARAASDLKRRDARYVARLRSVHERGVDRADPVVALGVEELRTLLERARTIAGGDPRDAAILERLIVRGDSARSVADDLGVSVENVYLIKHRLIRRLRDSLGTPE